MVRITFEGSGFQQGHYFFMLLRDAATGALPRYVPAYKSETIPIIGGKLRKPLQRLNLVEWKETQQLASSLVSAEDIDSKYVRIDVFLSSRTGNHKCVGSSEFRIGLLSEMRDPLPISDRKGRPHGYVKASKVLIHERNSFLSYIFGGCEISLMTAIDFTLSNREPLDPTSLHYFDLRKPSA